MKKAKLVCVIAFVFQTVCLFSQNADKQAVEITREIWYNAGIGRAHEVFDSFGTGERQSWEGFIPSGDDLSKSFIGINFGFYSFKKDKKIGLFESATIFFLNTTHLDTGIGFDLSIGPGFRIPVNETVNLFIGTGVNLHWMSSSGDKLSYPFGDIAVTGRDIFGFGLMCDFAVNIDITEAVSLRIGSEFLADWKGETSTARLTPLYLQDNDGKKIDMGGQTQVNAVLEHNRPGLLLRIKPYIAVSLRFWSKSTPGLFPSKSESGRGKPK